MKNFYRKLGQVGVILLTVVSAQSVFAGVENGQKFNDWRGVCLKDGNCGVEQLILGVNQKPEAHAFIRKANGEYSMHVRVPLYTNLEAGLFLLMGEEEVSHTPYLSCYITGCVSVVTLTDDLLQKMRAGSEMTIGTFLKEERNKFRLSLSGISKALDSL